MADQRKKVSKGEYPFITIGFAVLLLGITLIGGWGFIWGLALLYYQFLWGLVGPVIGWIFTLILALMYGRALISDLAKWLKNLEKRLREP